MKSYTSTEMKLNNKRIFSRVSNTYAAIESSVEVGWLAELTIEWVSVYDS